VTTHELVLAVLDSATEPYLHYVRVKDVILAILASINIAIIIYTYAYISSETRRHIKRLQTEQLPQEEAKRLKKENKVSKTLTIVLAALVLTYMPTIVLGVAVASWENVVKPHILSVLWSWIWTFVQLGSLLDPIIYFWRLKKLRRAVLEILHYRQQENTPPPIEMME
jgi:sterol desaturase/sphingolipid hydroxylase (fatty acid hydroxylase superfamily)